MRAANREERAAITGGVEQMAYPADRRSVAPPPHCSTPTCSFPKP
jgi:hypothetical protein